LISGHGKQVSPKLVLALQLAVCVYTLSGIAAKFASGYPPLSLGFIGCYAAEIVILGVYAILWQQIIKRVDISIAYANRAVAIFWSMLWAVLIFNEMVSLKNIVGVVLIFVGTWLVNRSG
jgi:drug/metabolite transporter (DMT)-like permease